MAMDDQQETVLLRETLLKDRYLLGRQLGEGGFGSVYLAQDRALHERSVVVKIQLHQSMDDPWFERKFSEEVRALSLIDHPGVVSAIDSGRTPDGKPFLVMQYVDGVTLRTVMTADGMALPRAAEILKQMGHALAAAHEKGIWHRDLKPENLMLQKMTGGGERVRLIDFGIATIADLATNLTATRVAGSILYMAPEQRMGQPSAAADIYAMGLIAYELLTGRKPFPVETAGQLTAMQRAGVRLKPSDLRPALSAETERLILQGLAWGPKDRPPDAREFGDQLYRSLTESDVTRLTGPAPLAERRRPRRWLGMAAVASLLAVIGAAGYYQFGVTPKPVPPVKVAPDSTIELAFWNSVKDSTEPQFYREYLAKYPQGQFASLAQAKLSLLSKDVLPPVPPVVVPVVTPQQKDEKDAWNQARRSKDTTGYQSYLTSFPNGKHQQDALKKLADFQNKELKDTEKYLRSNVVIEELKYWKSIQSRNDAPAYREYLEKYPQGLFVKLARRKLDFPQQP